MQRSFAFFLRFLLPVMLGRRAVAPLCCCCTVPSSRHAACAAFIWLRLGRCRTVAASFLPGSGLFAARCACRRLCTRSLTLGGAHRRFFAHHARRSIGFRPFFHIVWELRSRIVCIIRHSIPCNAFAAHGISCIEQSPNDCYQWDFAQYFNLFYYEMAEKRKLCRKRWARIAFCHAKRDNWDGKRFISMAYLSCPSAAHRVRRLLRCSPRTRA